MQAVRKPAFKLVYNGRDITAAFDAWPVEIDYTDKRHGESDEVVVKVHNNTGQWLDDWAPKEGDSFTLAYGYDDVLVPAGEFRVDEDSAEGDASGDSVDFKGLSAPSTQALRTKNTKAYEKQSLKEIVNKVAKAHGLTVEGEIDDISFDRVTQNGERDLEFLKRLADDYGHYFSVKGKKLVFTSRNGLRARDPVRVVDRTSELGQTLKRYSLRNSDYKAAAKVKVSYSHPQRKKLVGGEASTADDLGIVTASGDVVKIDARVETEEQAKRVAKSKLDKKNSAKITGDLELVGDPLLVAGQVIELKNFGKYDGRYLITQSKHSIRRPGYISTISIEKVSNKQRQDGEALKKRLNGAKKAASNSDDLGIMNADGRITKK